MKAESMLQGLLPDCPSTDEIDFREDPADLTHGIDIRHM